MERCPFRPLPCVNAKQGCKQVINAQDRMRHAARCPYRTVPCIHDGCGEQFCYKNLSEHVASCSSEFNLSLNRDSEASTAQWTALTGVVRGPRAVTAYAMSVPTV